MQYHYYVNSYMISYSATFQMSESDSKVTSSTVTVVPRPSSTEPAARPPGPARESLAGFKGSGPGPAGRPGVTVRVRPVKSWTSNSRYNVLGELGTLDTRGARVANVTSVPKF